MGIYIAGKRNAAVPEKLLHRFYIYTQLKSSGRKAVPQTMRIRMRYSGSLYKFIKLAVKISRLYRSAYIICENNIIFLIYPVCLKPVLLLNLLLLFKHLNQIFNQRDCSVTLCCLRLTYNKPGFSVLAAIVFYP